MTFVRTGSTASFQVSWAECVGDKSPNSTVETLKQFVEGLARGNGWAQLIGPTGGPCTFGIYATAVFHANGFPRIQLWMISNGSDHIIATHVCDQKPSEREIAEAHRIALSLWLGTDAPPKLN